MKDGLIVYLVSDSSLPAGFDVRAASRALGHRAQQVEVVSKNEGFFSVEDAWHFLMTRGCGRISLLVAQAERRERLKALGPAVRLCAWCPADRPGSTIFDQRNGAADPRDRCLHRPVLGIIACTALLIRFRKRDTGSPDTLRRRVPMRSKKCGKNTPQPNPLRTVFPRCNSTGSGLLSE